MILNFKILRKKKRKYTQNTKLHHKNVYRITRTVTKKHLYLKIIPELHIGFS